MSAPLSAGGVHESSTVRSWTLETVGVPGASVAVVPAGAEGADTLVKIAGTIAVIFGTINIVGGFLVTDRMLEMFKGRGQRRPAKSEDTG